jgi:hypothetical protein
MRIGKSREHTKKGREESTEGLMDKVLGSLAY